MRWLFLGANALLLPAGCAWCVYEGTEPCFKGLALIYLDLINFVVYGVIRAGQAAKARTAKRRRSEVAEHEPPW